MLAHAEWRLDFNFAGEAGVEARYRTVRVLDAEGPDREADGQRRRAQPTLRHAGTELYVMKGTAVEVHREGGRRSLITISRPTLFANPGLWPLFEYGIWSFFVQSGLITAKRPEFRWRKCSGSLLQGHSLPRRERQCAK